ncbi:MAG: sugar ABC transporter permease [Clostridia bacterium]|nr:sugar ABC transporter permease [Clostridia bacterium]
MKSEGKAKLNAFHAKIFGKNKFKYRYAFTGYALLAPAFILLTVFVVVPLLIAIVRSFFDYRSYADVQKFVGLDNYLTIIRTTSFVNSFLNALLFAVIIVVAQLLLSFSFAHVLKADKSGFGLVTRAIVYIPYLISGVAASIVFLFMTNYGGGLINGILLQLDMKPIAIDMEKTWARVFVILPTLWLGFGYNALVMYAGLINIPKDYYEAATLDGANWWNKLIKITVPSMMNYFLLTIVGLLTGALAMFEIPFMMTGGGPLESTLTPVLYLFNNYRNVLQSSSVTIAGAILVMIIIGTLNSVVFFLVQSKKSEDD